MKTNLSTIHLIHSNLYLKKYVSGTIHIYWYSTVYVFNPVPPYVKVTPSILV